MAEGSMLKEVYKDENQHNQHTPQPQHPHSNNVPVNTLKETLPKVESCSYT